MAYHPPSLIPEHANLCWAPSSDVFLQFQINPQSCIQKPFTTVKKDSRFMKGSVIPGGGSSSNSQPLPSHDAHHG